MDDAERRAKRAAYMREWHARNPEKAAEYHRRKAERDPEYRERARQRAREWYAKNRERAKTNSNARYHATKTLKGKAKGERVGSWKGDAVGYSALHRWVVRQKGNPSKCEHCGTETASVYDWANVDHKYRRDLDDWMRLCRFCHRAHDYGKGLSKKGGRRKKEPDA